MALVIADLVQETTSTTGTGTLTLTGAVTGFQTFAAIGDANTTYYRIKSGTDSEVGIGTYTLSGTTLSRDTVLYSSAGGTTKITVAAGATVICTYPAERAVALDAVGNLGVGVQTATSKVAVTDTTLAASGSLAGSALDIAQTWATTGNPTAIKLNVTNTASGGTAKLMDLQVGGSSKFSVDKSGLGVFSSALSQTLINYSGSNSHIEGVGSLFILSTYRAGTGGGVGGYSFAFRADLGYPLFSLPAGSPIGWCSTFTPAGTPDLFIQRDAANTLAQRNGSNSQTSRIYNTYTTASDWERLSLGFATYSGAIYAKLAVEGGGTSAAANIGIALSPKGTGAITAQVPDGTVVGGNARGANSVDLQTGRNLNTQVASGANSFAAGYGNLASGVFNISMGNLNIASGSIYATCIGRESTASANYTYCYGFAAASNKYSQVSYGLGFYSGVGDMQYSYLGFAGATTNATTTEIFLGNVANTRATIPNSTTWAADIDIVARSTSGTENAYFKRRLLIQKGTTAASTALIGAVQTVGTDIGSANMLLIATPITLSADTTNGSLKLEVTGIAATNIRWVAKVSLVEVGFA